MNSIFETDFFQGKNIFITGGTGSIGSQILHYVLPLKPKKVIVFSRDEYKQYQLQFQYKSNEHTKIEFMLGDVKDEQSLIFSSKGVDIIFHCAAYKHVPKSEEAPEEFIKTNVLGSMNIKKAALVNDIPVVVSISSDKAVYPSNVMGLTKAMQEKIFSSYYLQYPDSDKKFVNVRFGNVIGTKGSLFPIFYHQIMNDQPLTITDPQMTRFFMSQKQAVELIFWATINGKNGETVIKRMNSVKIDNLLKIFLGKTGKSSDYPVREIGIRLGEKLHESLITHDELFKVKEKQGYYIVSPYSEKEIEKNIISDSTSETKKSISEFESDNQANFFPENEIEQHVETFLDEAKHKHQIL